MVILFNFNIFYFFSPVILLSEILAYYIWTFLGPVFSKLKIKMHPLYFLNW